MKLAMVFREQIKVFTGHLERTPTVYTALSLSASLMHKSQWTLTTLGLGLWYPATTIYNQIQFCVLNLAILFMVKPGTCPAAVVSVQR
jgi:hypothetical protein